MQRRFPLLLSLLLLAGACGGSGKRGAQPSWRGANASATSSERKSAPTEFIELRASSSTVSRYNDPTPVQAPSFELSEQILSAVNEASSQMGVAAPVADGRLYRALQELAEVAPPNAALSYPLLEFAMQRNGILEPSPHLVIIWGDLDDPESIVRELREGLTDILGTGNFKRIGVGAAKRGKDSDLILLGFQESHLRTQPIARELPAGGSTALEGVLDEQFDSPHVFHTTEAGEVVNLSVARIGAKGFRARFECGQRTGKQQIEITAEDNSGSTVLANFPVWCGEKAPLSLRVASDVADPPPSTREEAEQRMLVILNQDRAEHGLAPLIFDERLVSISRLHSDEMLQTGQVAHISPTTGSASDRVKAGGVRTAVVLENVARAYGVGEAQRGLMNSPGHRANILSKDVSHVGIGITLGEEVAGRRELLVTQVFMRVPGAIEENTVRKQASARIEGIKAMSASADLQAIAQSFASELARGVTTAEASKKASEALDENRGRFTRVSTLVTTVADIAAFDPTGSLGGNQVRFYGVGVAQGSHAVMGDGAIFIVVLLGQR